MAKQKKQKFEGIVFSTDSNFEYEFDSHETVETLPPNRQKLKVLLDKKSRKGKVVTIVEGFVGDDDDLQTLAKTLKQKCGVGGSAKDGEILIQGDFKQKIYDLLKSLEYQVKIVGG
ncbi:translation initiation factor [Sphingobacterium litopenaei]|uniref:Translation initiation factor n=1 Tax=Sphingobacterium litopenaei TaxID=2763500 RepID=A0ABR7YDA3_9SPHI|nr:translation initiation factor [Sphingobacterium litopenaei]MBD1429294.1 translation initiation factor [Sphingobacterium litopenaei]